MKKTVSLLVLLTVGVTNMISAQKVACAASDISGTLLDCVDGKVIRVTGIDVYVTNPLDGLVFFPIGEFSVYGMPAEAGALATTSGSIGAYVEAGKGKVAGGAGAYVNISTVLACGG